MEREKEIEAKLKKEVEKAGGLCLKFISSVVGVPDRLVLMKDGKMAFVELKAPGRKPRKVQEVWIKRLRDLGFRVEVIDCEKGIREFVQSMKGEEKNERNAETGDDA